MTAVLPTTRCTVAQLWHCAHQVNPSAGGMVVRNKIVPLMRSESRVKPQLEATDDFVRVILPNAARGGMTGLMASSA